MKIDIRSLLIGVLATVCVLLAWGSAKRDPDFLEAKAISCEELLVRGKLGCLSIATAKDGSCFGLTLLRGTDEPKPIASFAIGEDGVSSCRFYGKDGNPYIATGDGPRMSSPVTLLTGATQETDLKNVLAVYHTPFGPQSIWYGATGGRAMVVFLQKTGSGFLAVFDATGKSTGHVGTLDPNTLSEIETASKAEKTESKAPPKQPPEP